MPTPVPPSVDSGAATDAPSAARRPRRLAALAAAALAAALAGACTDELETTAVCPDLCPEQDIQVQDTVLRPVVLDTSLSGFPLLGNEPFLALVRHGDTLDARVALRFDDLPQYYRTTATGTDSALVTQVVESELQLLLANRQSAFSQPVLVEAFDIAHAGDDTATAAVLPLFTPARRLGSLTVSPRAAGDTTSVDTLRVPIDPATLLDRVTRDERLRIGLRVTGAARASLLLSHGATLRFRPVADTTVPTVVVNTLSKTPPDEPGLQSDLRSYVIVAAGTAPPPPTAIAVGGLPARRSFLRFDIPSRILDSATIVRATLTLVQRPVAGFVATDTIRVQALPVTAGSIVTDIDRLTRLAANPRDGFGQEIQVVTPLALVPGDSGARSLSIANVVSLWAPRAGLDLQPALVLTSELEGVSPLGVTFYSSEAPLELQPTLRLSYIRRVNFDLP